jgi:hypothetical protein
MILSRDGILYGEMTDSRKILGPDGSSGSIFRIAELPVVISITCSNTNATLAWTSFTNGIYRVEYKSSLAATNWTAVRPDVLATGNTSSLTTTTGGAGEGYYRVVLLP